MCASNERVEPKFKTQCWTSGFQSGMEEAGTGHSYPKNKYKDEQTEKPTSLLRSVREVRSQGKLRSPETGEAKRQIQRITTYWSWNPKAQTSWEPVSRLGKLGCNWQTVGGCVWTSPRDKDHKGTRPSGVPRSCGFYLLEVDQALTANVGEKSPCTPGRRRGEGTFFF